MLYFGEGCEGFGLRIPPHCHVFAAVIVAGFYGTKPAIGTRHEKDSFQRAKL
jgi:hypothetical protein